MTNTIDPSDGNSESQEQKDVDNVKEEKQNSIEDEKSKENQGSTFSSKVDNASESEKKSKDHENNQSRNKSASFEDIFKEQHEPKSFDEFLKTIKATNVYIDARSGGFYSEKEINIEGDVAGRDQNKYTGFASQSFHYEEAVEYISKQNIKKIEEVYIKPKRYEKLEKILYKNHILIVKGDPQLGKRATSINLLSTFKPETILEISPSIKDIDLFTCQKNEYYLIDNPSAESIAKLRNLSLRKLCRNLKEKDSYLIIILDSQIILSEEILNEYGIDFNQKDLPTVDELLNKHLSWYLKQYSKSLQSSESIENIISNPAIIELLKNQLFPRDIDRLAQSLAQVIHKDIKLEDALDNYNLIVKKQVKSWFETHQDLKQRLFMITLAVLNKSNFQTVKNASHNLLLKVRASSDEENKNSEIVDEIFDSRSKLLEEVKASLVQGVENTEYGSSSVELAILNNLQYQTAVLSYIWYEYSNLRTIFLDWLLELGKSPREEIRIKIAAAIGYLSQQDFSNIHRQILITWANCPEKNAQVLAAIALTIPIWNGNRVSEILGLLHHWSTVKNRNLNRTAIETYARGVGVEYPNAALKDLFVIAESCNAEEIKLFLEVADAVISIFNSGKFISNSNNYLMVLTALDVWTKISGKKLFKSLFIFWRIMTDSKIELLSINRKLPTLLFLAYVDQQHEIIIVKLIQLLLNTKGEERILQKYALKELYNWLNLVDKEPILFKTFGRIISLLFHKGNEQEKSRINYYLNQWYSKNKSNSSKKILDVLSSKITK